MNESSKIHILKFTILRFDKHNKNGTIFLYLTWFADMIAIPSHSNVISLPLSG